MKPNGFGFFNKEDGITEDMNVAASQQRQYLQNYLKGFITPGFIPADNDLIGFDFKTSNFTMSEGSDVHHLDMNVVANTVMAIDTDGQVITIDADTTWKISPLPSESSGNIEIDLSNGGALSIIPPYDRWIWIKFKEIRSEIANDTRVDYDGGTQYPVKNIGYQIFITATNVNPDPKALFVVHVSVDISPAQIYYTEPSGTFPTDPLRLKASIKDSAVWALLESITFKPATYQDGTVGNPKRYSLKDHINSVGSAPLSPDNPHGIAPKDLPTYDSEQMTVQNKKFRNAFMAVGPAQLGALFNGGGQHFVYIFISTKILGGGVFFNGLIYDVDELTLGPGQVVSFSALEIFFDAATYPVAGYYKIHIPDGASTPMFVVDYYGPASSTIDLLMASDFSNEIVAGYVYWDPVVPELRQTDKFGNSSTSRIYGKSTTGFINPKMLNNDTFSYGTGYGRNLLQIFNTVDITELPNSSAAFTTGSGTAAISITNDGNTINLTVNCTSPGEFSLRFGMSTSTNSGDGVVLAGQQILLTNVANIYRSRAGFFDVAPDQVEVPANASYQNFLHTNNGGAEAVMFTYNFLATGTYNIQINGLRAISGYRISPDTGNPRHSLSSQIVYNTNFSKYNGVIIENRDTVKGKNLDRILFKTPQVTKLKQVSGTVQDSTTDFLTWGGTWGGLFLINRNPALIDNAEIWACQGLMVELGGGRYWISFYFDAGKYILDAASIKWLPGDWWDSNDLNNVPVGVRILDYVIYAQDNARYVVSIANAAGAAITGLHLYCAGTMILRRTAT